MKCQPIMMSISLNLISLATLGKLVKQEKDGLSGLKSTGLNDAGTDVDIEAISVEGGNYE